MAQQTILIVEDDDDLRQMYRVALTLAGFGVVEAGDGYQALRLIESSRPAAIVLDLALPFLDGRHVIAEVAGRPDMQGIPIIVVTALAGEELPEIDAGPVLRKPVSPDRLIRTVTLQIAAARTQTL